MSIYIEHKVGHTQIARHCASHRVTEAGRENREHTARHQTRDMWRLWKSNYILQMLDGLEPKSREDKAEPCKTEGNLLGDRTQIKQADKFSG